MNKIEQAHKIEDELKEALATEGAVSAEAIRRLIKKTHGEDARLKREQDIIAGALQQNQRTRNLIIALVGDIQNEMATKAAEVILAASPAPPPTQAELEQQAAVEAAQAAGKCDYFERIGDGVCGKKAAKDFTRCKNH